jgi:hypothetical protein
MSIVFLFDGVINDSPFLFQVFDFVKQVYVLKVTARFGALEVKTTVLILAVWLLTVDVPIVEHVNTNEVCHFVVHLLAIAKLEG